MRKNGGSEEAAGMLCHWRSLYRLIWHDRCPVDYALGLQDDNTPKYQHWRQAFRELVPGLPADALFDVG